MEEVKNFINIGIVQEKKGKVLIIKRTKDEDAINDKKLTWAFPGGKQKMGESREDCVRKEVLAETGYDVSVLRQLSLRAYEKPGVILVYHQCVLNSDKQIKEPSEPDEVSDVKWVMPSELKNYFTTDMDPRVAKFLGVNG